jgi:hypothetical protein
MNSSGNNKRRAHEHTDWNLKWVLWGVITLVVSVAIMLSGSWWVFRKFQYFAASRQMGTAVGPPIEPPPPRLEISQDAEWIATFQKEQAILHSYGWVDRSRGLIRIPIERQMQIIAERGFPPAASSRGQTK